MEPIKLQILHAADQEAGIPAIEDAVNFSAVMNALEDDFENTLKLSSGDIYIAGPFFNASSEIYQEPDEDGDLTNSQPGIGDILINNALGFQAVAVGNHELDLGTGTFGNLIASNSEIVGPEIDDDGYQGTQFPYLSTNIDFTTDDNLAEFVVPNGEAPQPNTISGSVVIEVGGEEIGIVGATTPA
ncbi:MAG: bifunctional metallophosphatase/5'-nucleotidase, partial [Okeania sp. SIO3B3]|nr:bifunctional metallophosphatase/5'-nucleotidase [Okeania sp. SIO3B3]